VAAGALGDESLGVARLLAWWWWRREGRARRAVVSARGARSSSALALSCVASRRAVAPPHPRLACSYATIPAREIGSGLWRPTCKLARSRLVVVVVVRLRHTRVC